MLEQEGRLPNVVVACVGGGSNAMGIFHPFINDVDVALVGVEAGGHGIDSWRSRSAPQRWQSRRITRQPFLSDVGRRRPDYGNALNFRGPGLPGCGSRAFVS